MIGIRRFALLCLSCLVILAAMFAGAYLAVVHPDNAVLDPLAHRRSLSSLDRYVADADLAQERVYGRFGLTGILVPGEDHSFGNQIRLRFGESFLVHVQRSGGQPYVVTVSISEVYRAFSLDSDLETTEVRETIRIAPISATTYDALLDLGDRFAERANDRPAWPDDLDGYERRLEDSFGYDQLIDGEYVRVAAAEPGEVRRLVRSVWTLIEEEMGPPFGSELDGPKALEDWGFAVF